MDKLKELFEGAGLPTDFGTKASVLFEAHVAEAVEARLATELAVAQESFEKRFAEDKEQWVKEQAEILEVLVDQVVAEWAQDNSDKLDTVVKSEVAESVIAGLKTAFEGVGIEIPQDKRDVLESAQTKLAESATQVASLESQLAEAQAQLVAFQKAEIVAEATEGMTDVAAERVARLAENLPFSTVEAFKTAVSVIAEAFGAKPVKEAEDKGDDKGNADAGDDAAKAGEDKAGPGAKDDDTASNDDPDANKSDAAVKEGADLDFVALTLKHMKQV